MGNGAILKNKMVIDTDKLVSGTLNYNLQGFLIKFSLNTIQNKFVHVKREDFNILDFNNQENSPSAGYYLESEFFKYLSGSITIDQLNIFCLSVEKLKSIELKKNEIVHVIRLSINSPYSYFYKIEKTSFPYNKDVDLIDDIDGFIIVPNGSTSVIQDANFDINDKGKQFYLSRKILINNFPPEKKAIVSYQLTLIGIYIKMINEDIFSSFITGTNNYSVYVDIQNYYWISNPDTFENPTIEYLEEYLNNLKQYYKAAYPNKLIIQNSVGIEKLYWLGVSLSTNALTNLPNSDKLDLIRYLIKNKLSNNLEQLIDEQLVIKLVASFNKTNTSEINDFLSNFISINKENGDGTQSTLYEILYNKMSTSTNLKSGLIALSNSWFGSSFKPTTTKSDFVQAVYRLWYYSEYNPYNLDGSLKPNTLGFRSFNNSLSSFSSIDISNYRYKYTHHTAYLKDYNDDPNNHYIFYKELYPEAAPMVIPYDSDKFIGIYFDNFSFKIEGKYIKMYQSLLVGGGDNQYSKYNEMDILFGKYKIFQPVSLLNVNVETKNAISSAYGEDILVNGQNINSFIPAFVLAHIDAEGDSSDTETMIGYTVDVATTFTGVGALTKMKHLRWASSGIVAAGDTALFSMNGLRIVVGGVEFTSGVLGFLANFVECGPDDDFCNGMKSFIMTLQIASLSVNAGDGLASFAMKLQAKRVAKAAGGGSDINTIRQNIENRLKQLYPNGDPVVISQTAETIMMCGLVPLTPSMINNAINKIKKFFGDRVRWTLHPDYTNAFLTDFTVLCRQELGLSEKALEDLVVFANRRTQNPNGSWNLTKFITPQELVLQANFFVKEILKRGFSAGFSNLNNYKLFCNATKSRLIQNLNDLPGNLSDYIGSLECSVKGSAARGWKLGDPEPIAGLAKPTRAIDDIDLGFTLSPTDYDNFVKELKMVIEDMASNDIDFPKFTDEQAKLILEKMTVTKNGKKKVKEMLKYDEVFKLIPVGNSTFLNKIRDAASPYTHFGSKKINFAIVKRGGDYDNLPEVLFKY